MAIYKDNNATKDGRTWYYLVYKKDNVGNNKKYKSKRYLTKKEAQQAEAAFLLKRDNPINKPFYLVADDYFNHLNNIRKESTLFSYETAYKHNIMPYFKDFNLNDINVSNITNWKNMMDKKQYKVAYKNKLYTVFNEIFKFAIKSYGFNYNPVHMVGRFENKNEEVNDENKKIRYITHDEFNKFISFIDDIQWKTFFIFLYYTGMRKGEVQALTWDKIDFEKKQILVNANLSVKTKNSTFKITSTKNNQNRIIKMNNLLYEQLLIYKKQIMEYTDFSKSWFVFGCSRFLASTTIDRYKHYYFNLADIKEITIHEFRHSHVSLVINEYIKSSREKNIKIDTAKFFLMMSNRMGHTLEVMTKTYLHLFPTIQDEIVDLLDNL